MFRASEKKVSDESGGYRERAATALHRNGISVAADSRFLLEKRDLVLRAELVSGGQARNTADYDRDAHVQSSPLIGKSAVLSYSSSKERETSPHFAAT